MRIRKLGERQVVDGVPLHLFSPLCAGINQPPAGARRLHNIKWRRPMCLNILQLPSCIKATRLHSNQPPAKSSLNTPSQSLAATRRRAVAEGRTPKYTGKRE